MSIDDPQPPDRPRREDRLKAILAAAFETFAVHGFEAARLDAIAAAAGISKATIYLYFHSKEQLFEEVVKALITPVVDQVVGLSADPHGAAEELLRRQIETIYREVIATGRYRMLRLIIAEGPRFPHLVDLYYREVVARTLAAIGRTIAYGVAAGEFRDTPLLSLPPLLIGPSLAGGMWKMLFDDKMTLDLDALRETHIAMLLRYLKR